MQVCRRGAAVVKFAVILAAAGSGTRMGTTTKKQFLTLNEKPLLIRSLEGFLSVPFIREWVIVTGADDVEETRQLLHTYFSEEGHPPLQVVAGGAERQESVYLGLQAIRESEYVLIHDGARPFVTGNLIKRIMDEVIQAGAVVPAIPVKDTIKQVDGNGWVSSTPERNSLWAVQTPQAFHLPLILEAHQQAIRQGWTGTDDGMLLEKMGKPVKIVMGEEKNIKITTPFDLAVGRAILEGGMNRGKEE